jgi:hypothetical protein
MDHHHHHLTDSENQGPPSTQLISGRTWIIQGPQHNIREMKVHIQNLSNAEVKSKLTVVGPKYQ